MSSKNIEVIKLGGSILRNSKAYKKASDIVWEEMSQNRLPVCVVSAMKGVTDEIITAVNDSYENKSFQTQLFVENLLDDHINALPIGVDASQELVNEVEKLYHVLAYIKSSGELTDSVYAYAISRGENFSSRILSAHLSKRGIKNQCFYGEELMVTDENFKEAAVSLEETRNKLQANLKQPIQDNVVPIIAGFAGRSQSGRVTIFGRGGTDDTAVNVGYGLGVKRVIKYVSEKGIMSINPQFLVDLKKYYPDIMSKFNELPEPTIIPYLSYVEAAELLREGRSKVVHYKVLTPLMKGNIELHIKNFIERGNKGTIIGSIEETIHESKTPRPKAISYQRNLYGVRILQSLTNTPSEVYSKVFESLNKANVDIRYLSTSGYQISFLVPEGEIEKATSTLKTLNVAVEVSPIPGVKGTFSVIGSEMRGIRGFFSKLTGVLGQNGVNIQQATQPNTENIIRFSVEDEDIPMAVASVYKEFFN